MAFVVFMIYNAKADIKDSVLYYLNSKKPELIGGLSARTTFIGTTKTLVSGVALGADYGGKIRLLAGIYWLPNSRPVTVRKTIDKFTASPKTVDEISKFWYLGLTGNYVFYKKGRWTLDVPVRIGFGVATVKLRDTSVFKNEISKKRSAILPVETGIGALYKITWWIGISGGLGSRIVIGKNTSQKFSGTYYNLGVTVFFGDIYTHIRDDMKINPVNRSNRN